MDGRNLSGRTEVLQDLVTFSETVSDTLYGYLNVKVSYGSAKIVKTSEDGKIEGISFTIEGNGINQTVKTDSRGEIQIDNLSPGVYTVTEQSYDRYEPQQAQRVTVIAGQTATVTFNNTLKRGSLGGSQNQRGRAKRGHDLSLVRHFACRACR